MCKLPRFALLSISMLLVALNLAGAADKATDSNADQAKSSSTSTTSNNSTSANNPNSQAYADAYKQTADTGKPLVILVGASWCPACQSMKTSIMPAVAADGGLKNVAFAYVNTDLQSDLAGKLMEGNMIPQLVKYEKTADGWTLKRLVGAQSVSAVESFVAATAPQTPVAAKAPTTEKKSAASQQQGSSPQAAVSPDRAVTSVGSHS